MSNVEFNEPNYGAKHRLSQKVDSWPTKLVIKLGLARNRDQAPVVLLIVGAISLLVMFFVGFGGGSQDTVTGTTSPTIDIVNSLRN